LYTGGLSHASEIVVERALSGEGGYACFCNVHVLVTARHEATLSNALADAWLRFPDGEPVAWMQRRLGNPEARRIGGPDLMPLVMRAGRADDLRHFLLGSTQEVLSALETALGRLVPDVNIVGHLAPPSFSTDHIADMGWLEHIAPTRPNIVWCALGAPKQELWMRFHAQALAPALVLGVGAAFDFLSGSKSRAPRLFREHGLEWLHRLGTEPRRLGGRYVRTNTEFMALAAHELMVGRGRRR
jgi:N-acetylglucosaminyldiphosphoundecaprenol N-acetyl-beta-D-mannosaminyltransferase